MSYSLRLVAAALFVSVTTTAPALSEDGIEVTDVWARATAPTAANGAAYMILTNTTGVDDSLLAAEADVAETIELHTHIMDGDVMRMRAVEAIAVEAGGNTELEPGGLHVMLIGLKDPLIEGDTFPLTLVFDNAGRVAVDVVIGGRGAMQFGQ